MRHHVFAQVLRRPATYSWGRGVCVMDHLGCDDDDEPDHVVCPGSLVLYRHRQMPPFTLEVTRERCQRPASDFRHACTTRIVFQTDSSTLSLLIVRSCRPLSVWYLAAPSTVLSICCVSCRHICSRYAMGGSLLRRRRCV